MINNIELLINLDGVKFITEFEEKVDKEGAFKAIEERIDEFFELKEKLGRIPVKEDYLI